MAVSKAGSPELGTSVDMYILEFPLYPIWSCKGGVPEEAFDTDGTTMTRADSATTKTINIEGNLLLIGCLFLNILYYQLHLSENWFRESGKFCRDVYVIRDVQRLWTKTKITPKHGYEFV